MQFNGLINVFYFNIILQYFSNCNKDPKIVGKNQKYTAINTFLLVCGGTNAILIPRTYFL